MADVDVASSDLFVVGLRETALARDLVCDVRKDVADTLGGWLDDWATYVGDSQIDHLPVILIAGVDRTTAVRIHPSLTIEDTRSDTPASCTFTVDSPVGWTPTVGMSVRIWLALRALFVGHIACVTQEWEGLYTHVVYRVACTGLGRSLDVAPCFGRYAATSATTIAHDLLPTGITGHHIEPGLAAVSIVFNGEFPSQAYTALAEAVGGRWYLDEWADLHFWVTSDDVEQPETLVAADILHDTLSVISDLSQVVTRVLVAGMSTTTVAPVFAGDTSIPLTDSSFFATTGLCLPNLTETSTTAATTPAQPAPLAYTGVERPLVSWLTYGLTAAGDIRIGMYSTTGLPSSGWMKTAAGVLIRYTSLNDPDIALRLPGSWDILSVYQSGVSDAGGYYTYVEVESGFVFPSSGIVTLYATGVTAYNSSFASWYIDATHFGFQCPTDEPNASTGYCGYATVHTIGSMSLASTTVSGITTTVCTVGFTVANIARVGDWVTIASCSRSEYNTHWQVSAVPDNSHLSFVVPSSFRFTSANGTCQVAGIPQATVADGTTLYLCDHLTGVSECPSLPAGTTVSAVAQADDVAAQSALAALDGSTGIRTGSVIRDASLTPLEMATRAEAELDTRKTQEVRIRYATTTAKVRAGTTITAAVTEAGLTGDYLVTRVTMTDFGRGPTMPPTRRVEASSTRFSVMNLWRRLQRTT